MQLENIELLSYQDCENYINEAKSLRDTVQLVEDPIAELGFPGINKQLSKIQAAKERMTDILLHALKNKSNAQRLVNNAKSSYGTEFAIAMSSDPDVLAQTSKEKREAAAAVKLQNQYADLQKAEDNLSQANVFNQVISTIAKDLENKQDLLEKQIDLIKMSMVVHPDVRERMTIN